MQYPGGPGGRGMMPPHMGGRGAPMMMMQGMGRGMMPSYPPQQQGIYIPPPSTYTTTFSQPPQYNHPVNTLPRPVVPVKSNGILPAPANVAPRLIPVPVSTSVYIGKIAETVDEGFFKKLLATCGEFTKWDRLTDPTTGKLKGFGFCEFANIEMVACAAEVLQGLPVDDSPLVVKPSEKTQAYLVYYNNRKEKELAKQLEDLETSALEDIETSTEKTEVKSTETTDGGMEEAEKEEGKEGEENKTEDGQPINGDGEKGEKKDEFVIFEVLDRLKVRAEIQKLLQWRRDGGVVEDEADREDGEERVSTGIEVDAKSGLVEPLRLRQDRERRREGEEMRRKEQHERQLKDSARRCRDLREREWEREERREERAEQDFQERLRRWELREDDKRRKYEELAAEERREKDRIRARSDYTSDSEDEFERTSARAKDRRRRVREREEEEDRRAEEEYREELKRREMELGGEDGALPMVGQYTDEDYQQSQDVHMKEPPAQEQQYQEPLQGVQEYQYHPEGPPRPQYNHEENYQHESGNGEAEEGVTAGNAKMTKLNISLSKKRAAPSQAPAFDVSGEESREFIARKKSKLAMVSVRVPTLQELVAAIPTDKENLFQYELDWPYILHANIPEEKLRPWIGKKIVEMLGEEEEDMISFIVGEMKRKCDPKSLYEHLRAVFDDDADDFMLKLWRMLIFFQLSGKAEEKKEGM